MNEAWVKFLLEHPTRGGIAERLIFEAGWRAGVESVGVPRETVIGSDGKSYPLDDPNIPG